MASMMAATRGSRLGSNLGAVKKTMNAKGAGPVDAKRPFEDVSNQALHDRNSGRNKARKSVDMLVKPSIHVADTKARGRKTEPARATVNKYATKTGNVPIDVKSKIPIKVKGARPPGRISRTEQFMDTWSEPPTSVDDVDALEDDLFCCPEFASDIMAYLYRKERRFALPPSFLAKMAPLKSKKPEALSANMRAVLVDWLIQVQVHLELLPETLHMAIAITDQVLVKGAISLGRLQLLGITALLMASKYEERFPPSIKKLIHLTDNTYKYEQVIQMERRVFRILEFHIDVPTAVFFQSRFLKIFNTVHGAEANPKMQELSSYLLDLCLTDVPSVKSCPSLRAASAIYLSGQVINSASGAPALEWNPSMQHYTSYTEAELQPCVSRLAKLLHNIDDSKYKGAYEKFSSRSQHGAISKWEPLRTSSAILTMAEA